MQYQCDAYKMMLERMYSAKMKQADRARDDALNLMYMVFKAEADAIDAELRACFP
ncbi:MAG: hypothetical protein H6999_06440 [Hahellaceae bacterium]|nr:hypothetical protein [Hahellaceae bacterium]MCP5169380.1 hypothetical protein [Hahellaceae bacterium]